MREKSGSSLLSELLGCCLFSGSWLFMMLQALSLRAGLLLGVGCACAAVMLSALLRRFVPRAGFRFLLDLCAVGLVFLMGGGPAMSGELVRAFSVSGASGMLTAALYAETICAVSGLIVGLAVWLMHEELGGSPGVVILFSMAVFLPNVSIWCMAAAAAGILLLRVQAGVPGQSRLLSAAAVLALVAVLLLVLPHGPVQNRTLADFGSTVRTKINDWLFFTEPRDVFSLSQDGFYPQGEGQLGGNPGELSEDPVLQVVTPKTVYLRGSIKNAYNGHAWQDTIGGRRYQFSRYLWKSERAAAFDENLPGAGLSGSSLFQAQTVRVRLLRSSASSLFVPQRIRALSVGGDLTPYFNLGSEVFATRNLKPGDTWTVSAPMTAAGDAALHVLINACEGHDDSRYDEVFRTYTQLPEHLQQMVYDLAERISSEGSTPYEKALHIRAWLQRNCRYTLQVENHPENVDFVTRFLFSTREGYCTYFASAMTVLCRMAGIPARYVEGYIARPDAQGIALVTGAQGHAWTEIYLKGFGWLTIDATPGAGSNAGDSPQDSGTDPLPPDEMPDEPIDEPDDGREQREEQPAQTEPPAPDQTPEAQESPGALRLLLPALTVLAVLAALARWAWSRPEIRDRLLRDPERRLRMWIRALEDALGAGGLRKHASESDGGFLARAEEEGRGGSLSRLGAAVSGVEYGEESVTPALLASCAGAWRAVRRELKPFRRVLLDAARFAGRQPRVRCGKQRRMVQ